MARTPTRTASDAAADTSVRSPNVLVILVTGDGPERLRTCLGALSRQTHPRIGILAVDNASVDGSAEVLRASLGADRVITLPEQRAFPGAVSQALRSDAAGRADYVVFMRDDTLLAPGTITALVEAAERMEGVGVVGPKVLDAHDPSILREIGMSVDLFGHPYSPLEKGEIDQGQYDRIREVFFVTSAAMLVSATAIARAGVPDERLGSDMDAMDYCWRIRMAGFRVLWTPTAVALQPGGSRARAAKALGAAGAVYQRERGALAGTLKSYGFLSLAWILPFDFAQMIVRVVYYLLSRRFEDAYQLVAAWGWNLAHLFGTGRRRARAQAVRAVPDRRIRQFMAPTWLRLNRWWRALLDGLRAEPPDISMDGDAATAPFSWSRIRATAAAHPVAVAWTLAVLVALVAYRHLLTASPLAGGSLAAFPSSPGRFFGEFVSGLRHTALGGTVPASPALPMLGVASFLSLGSPLLAQRLILMLLPFLAAVGCYRALGTMPIGRLAATVGAACYALAPVVLWGLSDGRVPELVFMAGLPWLTSRLIGFFGSTTHRRRVRWIVGAAVGLAALGSFFPGAFLAAAVITAVALVVPGGGGRVRGMGRIGLSVAGAAALAWPVLSGIVGSGGRSLADPTGASSFADVLRTVVGAAPGDWWLAFFLPVAAALGLGLASGDRGRPATRSLLMALAGVYLGWAASNGWLPAWLSNPAAAAGVAAFGMASLAALGLDSVIEDLQGRSFGLSQFGSAALVAVIGLGLAGQVLQASRGAWDIGGRDRLSPAYSVVVPQAGEAYRILWVGRRLGGELPAPAGLPMGTAASAGPALRFAVTAPAGASALDYARPLDGTGYDQLTRTISSILDGPTRHAGALLAPFGIRYVVAGVGDLPAAATARLEQQLDLVGTTAAGLIIYRDTLAVPLAAVFPDPAWRTAELSGDARAVAELSDPGAVPLDGSGGRWRAPPGAVSPGSTVLLSQQFDPHWQLTPAGGSAAVAARPAFGWAVAFDEPADASGFTVRFTGQAARSVQVALLAALWLAALWITRRPSRGE